MNARPRHQPHNRLRENSVYAQYIAGILQSGTDVNMASGCSKRPFSKAAASEEARRTLRYVEPLSDARTMLADFFSILLDVEHYAYLPAIACLLECVEMLRNPLHIGVELLCLLIDRRADQTNAQ